MPIPLTKEMKPLRLLTCILVTLCFSIPTKAHAQWRDGMRWESLSGDLSILVLDRWGRSCASGNPSSSYKVRGGAEGFMYPTDCNVPVPIGPRYSRFEDTAGAERCVGSVAFQRLGESLEAETTWTIEGPANGANCSTTGQTFNVKVFFVPPPPPRSSF